MLVAPQIGWEIFFDGASKSPTGAKKEDARDNIAGIWILFVSQTTQIFLILSTSQSMLNNTPEYEVVIARLELALQIPINSLTIYSNSELIVKRLHKEYSVKRTIYMHIFIGALYVKSQN